MLSYTIIEEKAGFALVEHDKSGKMTVVEIDRGKSQVRSAMPTDHPTNGGQWFGRISDHGIGYVSKLYSPSYARRIFRQLTSDAD